MLVLSRRVGESVAIGDRVTLTISRISGNRVALAFDAPRHIDIRRSELPVFGNGIDDERDYPIATSSCLHEEVRPVPK